MNQKIVVKFIWWPLVIAVIVFLIASIYIHYEMDVHEHISMDQLYKTCETGDLILFRWSFVDVGFRLFSKYCHAGIIYKDKKGDLFIIETHPEEFDDDKKETEPKQGVNIYPLRQRINEYNGSCYFAKLNRYTNLEINTDIIDQNIKEYKKIPFDDSFKYNYVKSWFFDQLKWKKQKRNVMYCSEFIAHVLKDLNIIHKNLDASSFSPSTFEHLNNKINKKTYGTIYTIDTDDTDTDNDN